MYLCGGKRDEVVYSKKSLQDIIKSKIYILKNMLTYFKEKNI